MTKDRIKNILSKGEGISTEFKEAHTELPANLFESICAFLNRMGGDLILGVKNDGSITGIKPEKVERLKINLINLSNNPNKLDPPYTLFPEIVDIDGQQIIYVRIPSSSQVRKTNNTIYDRNEDGDFKIKTHAAISRLYARKNTYFTENKIYPYLRFSDFKESLFQKTRNLIQSHRPDHPWLSLTNEEMLKRASLYKEDFETGHVGYTLAAALLFGKENVIQQILPFYKTDALLRREDLIRYDDRREIRVNLIEAYDELMLFIQRHLADKFYIENDIRVDLREKIFREVVANLLIHREYTNAQPARLIIYRDKIITENANNPVMIGPIDLNNFSPHPKNPVIIKFFQQLGRAEELGSGIKNIKKYLPLYSRNADFTMLEGDNFETVIYFSAKTKTTQGTMHVTMQETPHLISLILALDGKMSTKQLMSSLNLKNRENFRKSYVKPALDKGLIQMTIPSQPKNRNQEYFLSEEGLELKKMAQGQRSPNLKNREITTQETVQETMHVTTHVTTQETPQLISLILALDSEMSSKQLMSSLNLKNRENFRKMYLNPALKKGIIQMTISNQPKNRNQKYFLTKKGLEMKSLLKERNEQE